MPSDGKCLALDKHFRGPHAAIVVRALHETVGSGRADGEQDARLEGQFAVAGDEVGGFANRADYVPAHRAGVGRHDRLNVMPGPVQRRPNQVVHGGVDHGEAAHTGGRRWLQVLDAREQDAGFGHEVAAGFDEQFECAVAEPSAHHPAELRDIQALLVAIGHAEAPADVDVLEANALGRQRVDQVGQRRQGILERFHVADLRADVAVDAHDVERGRSLRPAIEFPCERCGHPEFVLLESR